MAIFNSYVKLPEGKIYVRMMSRKYVDEYVYG